MREKDGGPAFPAQWVNQGDMNSSAPDGSVVPPGGIAFMVGMSLRDYFAAQVLSAASARLLLMNSYLTPEEAAVCAQRTYMLADAMLAARERK
jgi:hypothetical protein